MLTEFHFLRPWWLILFVPMGIFLLSFARRRFEMRRWRNIVDPQLMPHVLIGTGYRSRRRITALLASAGSLMITALAGPAWQQLPQPVFRSQDALVIALDLSRSMDTADIKPSRLARARFKIADILEQRDEGQTALLAYAAEPFVISPLTDDTQTIVSQLPALTTDLMPSQGSRADRALEKGADLLRQSGIGDGRILLVTDGVNFSRAENRARELKQAGIRVSVLGVGTDAGGPIPGQGGFIKRRDGSIVITKLDEAGLRSIAARGGGSYSRLAADTADIDRLLEGVEESGPGQAEATDRHADIWRDEGPWLLLPLLPLAALAFRRGVLAGWLLAALVLSIMAPVRPAQAYEWSNLWSRPDQRATRKFEEGDSAAAAELFTDPAWKGVASYRAGRYEESLAALDGLDGVEPTYNRGNALAKLGRFDEAIAAYDQVLEQNPKHHDARYNRDLLVEQKKQQQQQQQQQQEESDRHDESTQSGESPQEKRQNSAQQQTGDNEAQETEEPNGSTADGRQRQDDSMSNAEQPRQDSGTPQKPGGEQQTEPAAWEGESDADEDGQQGDTSTAMAAPNDEPLKEDEQATEQWLRRIPDDPGGLLRRKFYYQYQQRGRQDTEQEPW